MQHKLSENIKKYRKEMNLTQSDLAEAFGITEGAVSKWESGNTVPDISLLMDLADFFDISVDTLLGYSISSKNIDDIIGKMKNLLDEGKYDEAVSVAEKALVRYPGNFKILYKCAHTYGTALRQSNAKEYCKKAIELYENSIRYLYQNTDPEINEFVIKMEIAHVKFWDDIDKALADFEALNYMGVSDVQIARILMRKGKTDEALDKYTRTMVRALIHDLDMAAGMFIALVSTGKNKAFVEASELMEWYLAIIDATSNGKISYLTKMKTVVLAFKAMSLSCSKDYEIMRQCLDEALALAKEFDKKPSNDFNGKIKFWHASEDFSSSVYDEIGCSAVDGIDNLFDEMMGKATPDAVVKKMKEAREYWDSIKHNE
ncbi:helix-turn-helix domain-containing protein [Butyrivibrio hungatei]|uniref:HTH/TPR domain-containing protein n=1 Tax=Butyrivibrio hungatei TaxID=185008 RepID=A0A1D9P026_9FIRM|nr:helix-turn-helix transcriptional regulator [Butyrivibrio hungatei]AOZ95978.1 HTH/TPR domain-containing protein [Butyrivibrio hungatei]